MLHFLHCTCFYIGGESSIVIVGSEWGASPLYGRPLKAQEALGIKRNAFIKSVQAWTVTPGVLHVCLRQARHDWHSHHLE